MYTIVIFLSMVRIDEFKVTTLRYLHLLNTKMDKFHTIINKKAENVHRYAVRGGKRQRKNRNMIQRERDMQLEGKEERYTQQEGKRKIYTVGGEESE